MDDSVPSMINEPLIIRTGFQYVHLFFLFFGPIFPLAGRVLSVPPFWWLHPSRPAARCSSIIGLLSHVRRQGRWGADSPVLRCSL